MCSSDLEVVVGGVDAPLYFLSPGQLNIQIPYELSPLSTYQIVAIVNNAVSNPQSIDLVAQVPGITSFADGRLIAQHADFTLVSASSPAKPGEILVMYLAGMGFTSTPVRSGTLSPATQVTVPAKVTVDGINAEVFYAGLTPGGIGLYQINFRVPTSVKADNVKVQVIQGPSSSNVTTLPVVP